MMVLKMRFENPEVDYVKDLESRECYGCVSRWVCSKLRLLEDVATVIRPNSIDMIGDSKVDLGIYRAWVNSYAVFCKYFKEAGEE